MPNPTHKSAAVPFVNQKGERSMKRVKVERYVAGKKPSYANDEDEEEYYTTDEEESVSDESEELSHDEKPDNSRAGTSRSESELKSLHQSGIERKSDTAKQPSTGNSDRDSDNDCEIPKFKSFKKIESRIGVHKHEPMSPLSAAIDHQVEPKYGGFDDDDDEDEEMIRRRHMIARSRKIEEPIGPQIALDEFTDQQLSLKQEEFERSRANRIETDDILKDLKLTGIRPKEDKKREKQKNEQKLKEMLDKAKEQAAFQSQLHKRVEEDAKREQEKDLLGKTFISTNQLESVKTDDEDEEIAYEEWKLREIQRVLRDRSERRLEQLRAK